MGGGGGTDCIESGISSFAIAGVAGTITPLSWFSSSYCKVENKDYDMGVYCMKCMSYVFLKGELLDEI